MLVQRPVGTNVASLLQGWFLEPEYVVTTSVSMINMVSLGRKDIKRGCIHTGAAIIDVDRAGAIDGRGKFTTLAIADVSVRFHGGVEGFARGVDVEMDSGCGGDDDEGAVELQLQQQQRDW